MGAQIERQLLLRRLVVPVVGLTLSVAAVVGWRARDVNVAGGRTPLVAPSVFGEKITRVVDPSVGLDVPDEGERACLLVEVSSDVGLVEALGERPRESARFADVERLHDECEVAGSLGGLVRMRLNSTVRARRLLPIRRKIVTGCLRAPS
jgi:hypothetical protein